jgi:ActR/RegA family two-component response regulator
LLVRDDDAACVTMNAMLESRGFDVVAAAAAQQKL